MIYLDTSAFLKLYFRESGSDWVHETVVAQDEPLPVWDMLDAEFRNACQLKVFWGDLTSAQAARQVDLFEQRLRRGQYHTPDLDRTALMQSFRSLCQRTGRTGCRTMDILHVACAQQLAATRFISFDTRQRALASQAGLSVPKLPA